MKKAFILRLGLVFGLLCWSSFGFAERSVMDLGRVFLTPDERLALDKMREDRDAKSEQEEVEDAPLAELPEALEEIMPEPAPLQPSLEVNGFVRRHGTSGTVWINGESSYDGDLAASNVDHLQTRIVGERIRVAPLNSQQPVYLKPGQVYEPNDDKISDSYSVSELPVPGAD